MKAASENGNNGEYVLILRPAGDSPLTVLFEPGAGEFELEPATEFRIEISGAEDERLEFSHGDGFVAVWPSPALTIRVTDGSGADLRLLGY